VQLGRVAGRRVLDEARRDLAFVDALGGQLEAFVLGAGR
jgi:hypothetical protein